MLLGRLILRSLFVVIVVIYSFVVLLGGREGRVDGGRGEGGSRGTTGGPIASHVASCSLQLISSFP